MSEVQTHVEPAPQYEIETAAEPGVRARRVLTLLRSIQDCHRSLMREKEAGALNRAEMEEIDEAITRMASGQRSLMSLLKRLLTQELEGGSLHVELVGNVQSEKDWKILEAVVDVLNPLQQQLDQQGATSTAAASVAATASADESPGPLRRWILDRGKVILTVFTRILDLWLEDFVFLAMSRLNPIQWLVRRRWDGETEGI
ncbi:hypothetical protein ACFX2I_005262 [Malus domestica]